MLLPATIMVVRFVSLVTALLLVATAGAPARTDRLSVEDVRAGMVGTGLTVFEGTRREEFRAHILGVLENVLGPRRNLIVARLEGGPLASAGVIAGMSGSPVYVDGRLIGAVAYQLGSFAREPIAGITPIAEMIDAASGAPPARAARAGRWAPGFSLGALAADLERSLGSAGRFADGPADVRVVTGAGLDALAADLRPIATPLSIAGLGPEALMQLRRALGDSRMLPVTVGGALSGRAAAQPADGSPALAPGDAVGVVLVTGDLSVGATGTVTMVEGSRVYAFGHPLYNLGPIAFPMTRAYVHAIIPSLFSSVRLASVGDAVGSVEQDRATTIAGRLGAPPPMIPLSVTLEADRGPRRRFSLRVIDDEAFTPLFIYVSLLSILQGYERDFGAASYAVTGEARVAGVGHVSLANLFAGDGAPAAFATAVTGSIGALVRNPLGKAHIDQVALTVRSSEEPRVARLERAWLDAVEVRPGQTVPLKVQTRTWRGDSMVRTVPVVIPERARGPLTLLVTDAARLTEWEQREGRAGATPDSLATLVRLLNQAHRSDRLYVRLIAPETGAVVGGETLPSLPPSVLGVLQADRDGGSYTPLRTAVLGAWEVPLEHALTGTRTLTFSVEPR